MDRINLHTWELVNDDLEVFKEEIKFLTDAGHDIKVTYTETWTVPEGFSNSGTKFTLAMVMCSAADQRRLRFIVMGQ